MPGLETLRRRLIGTPLPTSAHHEERYSNAEALAILSSDALSSVACATQEIVLVLVGQLPEVPLEVLESPYRSLVDPVVAFVQRFEKEHRKDRQRFCMIVLPVFVTRHRWENLLHNQSTILLRRALRERGTRVVTTVGFYL